MSTPVNKTVILKDLGGMRYADAWDLQERMLAETVARKRANRESPGEEISTDNYLLLVEHPHVYTLGKSGKPEHLLLNEAEMEARGIDYFKTNRGGDITYHGPGQIVGYPLFDLDNFRPDIHEYLRKLEEAAILLLRDYGIESGRIDGLTGVWLDIDGPDPRKILAIGVRCSMWVTMHGFAFNVNTDLDYFGHIIPCGIDDKGVTSLSRELGRPLDYEQVKTELLAKLREVFGFEWATEPVASPS